MLICAGVPELRSGVRGGCWEAGWARMALLVCEVIDWLLIGLELGGLGQVFLILQQVSPGLCPRQWFGSKRASAAC